MEEPTIPDDIPTSTLDQIFERVMPQHLVEATRPGRFELEVTLQVRETSELPDENDDSEDNAQTPHRGGSRDRLLTLAVNMVIPATLVLLVVTLLLQGCSKF